MTDKEQPIPALLYDHEYYTDGLCRGHREFASDTLAAPFRYALNLVELRGINILDVGCGRGEVVMACAAAHPENECYGVDYSEAAVEICRTKLETCEPAIRARAHFFCMDAKRSAA